MLYKSISHSKWKQRFDREALKTLLVWNLFHRNNLFGPSLQSYLKRWAQFDTDSDKLSSLLYIHLACTTEFCACTLINTSCLPSFYDNELITFKKLSLSVIIYHEQTDRQKKSVNSMVKLHYLSCYYLR